MYLKFYENKSGENVINKDIKLAENVAISARGELDLDNPVLRLNGRFAKYNYCELLGRFYFVREVRKINHAISDYFLECDVLETYKDDILNSVARVKRSIKKGDYQKASLNDSHLQNVFNYKSDVTFDITKDTYVLSCVGA